MRILSIGFQLHIFCKNLKAGYQQIGVTMVLSISTQINILYEKEKPMNFVIIGGDAAGMSAASRVKRTMPDVKVTVFEKTLDVSYSA